MSIDADRDKIESIINSCKTKQHIIVAKKMVDLFSKRYMEVLIRVRMTNVVDKLNNLAHNKSLQLKRIESARFKYEFC